jgi:hypothetical protein
MTLHQLFAAEATPTKPGLIVGAASAAKSFSHCYDQILLIYSRIFMISKSISWH